MSENTAVCSIIRKVRDKTERDCMFIGIVINGGLTQMWNQTDDILREINLMAES